MTDTAEQHPPVAVDVKLSIMAAKTDYVPLLAAPEQAYARARFPSAPDIRPQLISTAQQRSTMEMCFVPQSVYVGVQVEGYDSDTEAVMCLCSHDGTYPLDYHEDTIDLRAFAGKPDASYRKSCHIAHHVLSALQEYMCTQHYKIHALAIGRLTLEGPPSPAEIEFATRAWFDFDVVPVLLYARPGDVDERASSVVRKVVARMSPQFPGSIFRIPVTHRHEVEVDNAGEIFLCSLVDYQRTTKPEIFRPLLKMAQMVRTARLRISFFSSTPQGGGVALMRHALLRLARLLGIDMHWYVAKPKPDVFDITKSKFHNILQGVAPPDVRLTADEQTTWCDWVLNNVKRSWVDAKGPIMRSHVIIVDIRMFAMPAVYPPC